MYYRTRQSSTSYYQWFRQAAVAVVAAADTFISRKTAIEKSLTPPQEKPASAVLVWLLVVVLTLIWGTSFILIKKGLAVFSSDELGAMRIVIACTSLLPFAVANLRQVEKHRWKFLLASGLLGNLFAAFLFAYAETRLASGLAGVLNSLTALFTLLIGAIFFRQQITWLRMVGIVIGMAGTVMLILAGSATTDFSNMLYGLLIVVATICYGGSANLIKFRLQGIKPIVMSSLALLTVGPMAAVYLATTDVAVKFTQAPDVWEAFMYIAILAVFSTAVGLILLNKLIQISTPVFASTINYLIPVVALLWGVLDGETIHLWHYGSMVVILAGVFIVNRAK